MLLTKIRLRTMSYSPRRLALLLFAMLLLASYALPVTATAAILNDGGGSCDASKYVFDAGTKYIANCEKGRFTVIAGKAGYYASDAQALKYEIVLNDKSSSVDGSKNQAAVLNEYELITIAGQTCDQTNSYAACVPSAARTERKPNSAPKSTNITVSKDVTDDNAANLATYQYDNEVVDGQNVENNLLRNNDGSIVLRKDGRFFTLDTTAGISGGIKYSLLVLNDGKRGNLTTITCTAGTQNASGYGSTGINCGEPKTVDVLIVKDDDPTKSQSTERTTSPPGSAYDACKSALGAVGWIFCPVVNFADTLYSGAKKIILDLLFIKKDSYSANDSLENTWAVVKNVATTGLVLVALVMVASQIFSFEIMSPYTVKKVLPRLVIAAILMQLSWFIFTTLIQISNAIGLGLYYLLINAFGAEDIMNILGNATESSDQAIAGLASMGFLAGVFAGGLALLAPGAWITLVITLIGVVVSILVAIFTLLVRKMLIVILLVISPLALLFWILPGTQNLWSAWWKLFSRLLAMFPLIALLFAAGAIGANIVMMSGEGGWSIIATLIIYFAPLFLIGATFKFAGSVFGAATAGINKLGGKVNSSGFGLRARKDAYTKLKNEERAKPIMRKARENMGSALSPEASSYQRLRGRSALGFMGYMPGGKKRMNSAYLNYAGQTEAAELQEASQSYNALSKDMDFDTKVAASRAIASSTGSSATYQIPRRRADGSIETAVNAQGQTVPVYDTKQVDVNDAMRRTAAKYVAQSGDVDSMRATVADLRSSGRPDLASKILDENVGDLIKTAPDLYNKTAKDLGHRDLASVKPNTLRNFVGQTYDWRNEALDQNTTAARRTELQTNIRLAAEEAGRALSDSELSMSPMSREMLQAMASIDPDLTTTMSPQDKARLEGVIGTDTARIDFAGRKPNQEGYDPIRHSL